MHGYVDAIAQINKQTSVVIHTYNPSSREVKVGGSVVQGQVEVFQGYLVMSRPASVTRYCVSCMCVYVCTHICIISV